MKNDPFLMLVVVLFFCSFAGITITLFYLSIKFSLARLRRKNKNDFARNYYQAWEAMDRWRNNNPCGNLNDPDYINLLKSALFHLKQYAYSFPQEDKSERPELVKKLNQFNDILLKLKIRDGPKR